MDDNRVKNIKEKFEGISHVRTTHVPTEHTNSSGLTSSKIITKTTDNESNINHRANIKRTPAFRKDKVPIRNTDKTEFISKSADSLVTNRVHLFNKLKEDDTVNMKRDDCHDEIKENKPLKIESQIDIKELKSKNINELKRLIHAKSDSDFPQYAKVNKPVKKLAKDKKTESTNPPERHLAKQISAPSMIQNMSKAVNDELSDTLKRVLRSPLPPGPPPKKPPRTFISKPPIVHPINEKITNHDSVTTYGKINSPEGRDFKIPIPIRSKTESEIMLRKIENALLKHQEHISLSKEPWLDTREKGADKGHNRDISCFGASPCTSPNEMYSKASPSKVSCEVDVYGVISSRKSSDPIYEDPNDLKNPSVPLDSSLYYMSTPIESIINSSEMACLKENETRDAKRIKNIADVIDKYEDKADVLGDPSMENKIKLWMDEAYSKPLQHTVPGIDSDLGISSDTDGLVKEDHTEQCVQVTLLRKGYVQKVASRTVSRQQSILAQSDNKHLFECLLLIGLNLDNSNNKVPYIKMKYPANTNVPQCIEHLCFPDAHEWSNDTEIDADDEKNRCYTMTITSQGGERKYAYCRRIKPEGELALLPLSYCILSSHKANEFYFQILEEVEARHGKTEVEFFNFIRELYENRFPPIGEGIVIRPSSEERGIDTRDELIKRSSDPRLEDLQLAKSLEYLKINIFLLIFSSMLLERKIILISSSISKLSFCIEGLQIALLPFQWQHTLITVVPSTVISVNDLCDAPTPYLIGLLKSGDNSSILSSIDNTQQVIVVDIDEQKVLKKVGDEQSILPIHLTKGLKNALQLAHSSETRTNNLLACEAFMRLFVELVGHYRSFVISSNLDRIRRKMFQKEAFLRATSTQSVRMFLEWFVETAAFSAFIESHLQNFSNSRGLFDQRCNEYIDELNRLKYAKNNKMLKTVKQIGDFLKDLIIVAPPHI